MTQPFWSRELDPPELPRILKTPPARGSVLVIAPHADDETVGMGGTIVLHGAQGDPVDVLVLTHGATGDADSRYDRGDYIRIRREEARAACDRLGVREILFWDYPDSHRVTEEDLAVLVPRLNALIDERGYEVVYAPHWHETHTDHHVGAVIAIRAKEMSVRPFELFGYEVWAPLKAEVVVDIGSVFSTKLEAAACYPSQNALNDIALLFRCLNGYRAQIMEDKLGQGEAFCRMGKGP